MNVEELFKNFTKQPEEENKIKKIDSMINKCQKEVAEIEIKMNGMCICGLNGEQKRLLRYIDKYKKEKAKLEKEIAERYEAIDRFIN